MARRCFFSFHYEPDNARVAQVQNHGYDRRQPPGLGQRLGERRARRRPGDPELERNPTLRSLVTAVSPERDSIRSPTSPTATLTPSSPRSFGATTLKGPTAGLGTRGSSSTWRMLSRKLSRSGTSTDGEHPRSHEFPLRRHRGLTGTGCSITDGRSGILSNDQGVPRARATTGPLVRDPSFPTPVGLPRMGIAGLGATCGWVG